ncbi:hypothetical protein [Terriglobus saanensis]|uniref:Outer membrane protein beta-barrel domain-containing protein n=1 Tax=Terriglobus saanensis (strain ATCC BAA-1853 / DSM 23119 / SP1PR4) TaxID=401053 RepID=E8V6M4_TERSS|nr:hypothetical protein [Terriglobus saanensis]ADV82763.1 hypothetical protein AciPR4_1959 [Terriglobus saanensis SP1PR4]
MKVQKIGWALALLVFCARGGQYADGQAEAAGVRKIPVSAFVGGTGNWTGLYGGKNLGINAGLDVGLHSLWVLQPSFEIRAMYPVHDGHIDSQKNILVGFRFDKNFNRLTPYVDVLYGLGKIVYDPARPNPTQTFAYTSSSSNVFSPGVGLEYRVVGPFSFKADAQIQRYSTPVTETGHIYAKPVTVGITYQLFTGRRH